MKKTFIYCIGGIFVAYLVTSFTLWDFNPANWSAPARFSVFFFGISIGGFVKLGTEL